MRFPNRETVERVRRQYPVGCRVELVRMDDVQAPPPGTQGTVWEVDDTASICVHWDNESGLSVVYGEDFCRRIDAAREVQEQRCPHCGAIYTAHPAVSRRDGKTLICPDCGTRSAIAAYVQSVTASEVAR